MTARAAYPCAEDLVRKKIRDPTDFEWLKQCRFYWRDDRDTVIISICDVDFEYSFEYLGGRAGTRCGVGRRMPQPPHNSCC